MNKSTIIEFLHLTQTLQEVEQELEDLHSFIKTYLKPKKKIVIPKVIPFLKEDTVDEWLKDLSLKEDNVQEEYCYEDDNFTYTTDPKTIKTSCSTIYSPTSKQKRN